MVVRALGRVVSSFMTIRISCSVLVFGCNKLLVSRPSNLFQLEERCEAFWTVALGVTLFILQSVTEGDVTCIMATASSRVASGESCAYPPPPGLNTPSSPPSTIICRHVEFSPHILRTSLGSASGESILTISSDSKYPPSFQTGRGFVAYAYNSEVDDNYFFDDEDIVYNSPQQCQHHPTRTQGRGSLDSRGFVNIATLVTLLIAILMLFVVYPAIAFYRNHGRNQLILTNHLINSTGQFPLTVPSG